MALHIRKIKPRYSEVLVTGDKYEKDEKDGALTVAVKGDLKLYQTVLAVGSMVRDIEVGDKIMFDPKNYAIMKYDENSLKNDMDMNKVIRWNLPWVTVDDEKGNPRECLLLTDRDIQFVFEGEEVNKSIILPDKPVIIMN